MNRRRSAATLVLIGVVVSVLVVLQSGEVALPRPSVFARPVGGPAVLPAEFGGPSPLSRSDQAAGATLAGGIGTISVNSSDPLTVPNSGLRFEITLWPYSTLPPASALQMSAEEMIAAHEAVFGIFQNSTLPPTAFFAVFHNGSGRADLNELWVGNRLQVGETYVFELDSEGAGEWELFVDSIPFGGIGNPASRYNFGANNATWAPSVAFSIRALFSSASTVPPRMTAPVALDVMRSTGWYLAHDAEAYYNGTPSAQWGVAGRLQNGSLAPGEVQSGQSVAPVANGTVLWNGPPVPVRLRLIVTPSSVPGTGIATVVATVIGPTGTLLPGVPVGLSDSFGGQFTPVHPLTNGSGDASSLFIPPNVTSAASDLVHATTLLVGYVGSNTSSVEIVPAQHVQIGATFRPGGGAVTGITSATLTVTTPGGAAVGAVHLALNVTGPLNASTSALITGTNGTATLSVRPTGSGVATIVVTGTGNGSWGHASFSLRVLPGSPLTIGQRLLLVGVPVGAVAMFVAVFVVTSRRRRRPCAPGQ